MFSKHADTGIFGNKFPELKKAQNIKINMEMPEASEDRSEISKVLPELATDV